MANPSEGKGREHEALSVAFPFLFVSPRVHPAVFLVAALSLVVFVITAPRYDWPRAAFPWILLTFLAILDVPRLPRALRKLAFVSPFLALSLFFHAFFTPGEILARLGPLYVTRQGLRDGAWITQKLTFLFGISFAVTCEVPSLFVYQVMGRLSRLPMLRSAGIRQQILTLFLILQWLKVLPRAWKARLKEHLEKTEGRGGKVLAGLRTLPSILGNDLRQLDRWISLFVARGYAEGILHIADAPFSPAGWRDAGVVAGILTAWCFWLFG